MEEISMSRKAKMNIGMFLISLILIGYGYVLGRTSSANKEEDEGA